MACRVKASDCPGITSGKNCQALSPLDRLEEFDALRMGVVNRSVGIGREPIKLEGDGRAALRWRDSELGRGLTCGPRRPSPSRITRRTFACLRLRSRHSRHAWGCRLASAGSDAPRYR